MTDIDERARENMDRLLLVLVAGLMMQLGFRLWEVIAPTHWVGAVVTSYAYATALGLLVAAVVDVDLEQHGYKIGAWCVFVLFASTLTILWLWDPAKFGTDALLYSRYSVDLLLSGENPFASSMGPAIDTYNAKILHVTPLVDGDYVTSLSYPAGMVWWFVPQAATGIGKVNLAGTLLVTAVAVLVFLILEGPASLALAPVAIMLGARNLIWSAAGGLLEPLWVLPLLVAMHYWHRGRLGHSAVAFGLAAGTKQTVWPIAPALAIWLWHDADSPAQFLEDAWMCISRGFAGFLVLNLPFIVWDPQAWLTSVFTPLGSGAAMVHQGVGPTLLTITDVYALPKGYYTLLTVASFVVALGLYALYWDRVKWVAWIIPPLVFFWFYRSLNSYFVWFLPVGYYAMLCHLDLRRPRWAPVEALLGGIAKVLEALFVDRETPYSDALEAGKR